MLNKSKLDLDFKMCEGCSSKAFAHNRFTACTIGMFGMVEGIHYFCVQCSHPDNVLPKNTIGFIPLDNEELSRYMNYINRRYKDCL